MGFDLDRLERLAGGLAVLFYVLLFLAFITAIMGSGGGGLLLLGLGAVAHVGRVGLEDFVERRRQAGDLAAPEESDAGLRATGLRLKWLPSEIRLPRQIDLGAIRSRVDDLKGTRSTGGEGPAESGGGIVASSGEAAGVALGRAGELFGSARADLRTSFAALVAEVKERPEGASRRSFTSPHRGVAKSSSAVRDDDGGLDFGEYVDDFDAPAELMEAGDTVADPAEDAEEVSFTDSRYEDFEVTEGEYEEIAEPDFAFKPVFVSEAEAEAEPEPYLEPVAGRPQRHSASTGAPTAQERYEARRRARGERGEAEPIVVAVEEAETQRPQRVQRRDPGGRPDPLRTRRPTRTI